MNRKNFTIPDGGETLDTAQAQIRQATQRVVAIRRGYGEDDAAIRVGVIGDFKEAFDDDCRWVTLVSVDGLVKPLVSLPRIYRRVLVRSGLVRPDPRFLETLFAWVRGALDETLDDRRKDESDRP